MSCQRLAKETQSLKEMGLSVLELVDPFLSSQRIFPSLLFQR